jgi:hypothetical protein
VAFPSPFDSVLSGLSVFSFEFISLECVVDDSNHMLSVLAWSAVPLILLSLNLLAFVVRLATKMRTKEVLIQQHVYIFLMLSYLVLPPVSRKQFQALDCVEVAGDSYLRVDTSIRCESQTYLSFKALNSLLVAAYMSLPFIWFVLLWKERSSGGAKSGASSPLFYLFGPYRSKYYWCECAEMLRRVMFVGALPLVSTRSARRAAFGIVCALISLVLYREAEPFTRPSNNTLSSVAQFV